jgi:LEA14-like dessication related protein
LKLALLLFLASTSCTTLKAALGIGLLQPEIKLRRVAIRGVSAQAMDLNVDLQVANPNDFPVELHNVLYVLGHKEAVLASGQRTELVKIGAGKNLALTVPLRIDLAAMRQFSDLLLAGTRDLVVNLRGAADFRTELGSVRVKFDKAYDLANER